ncbi:MAG: cell division inhibitor SepF [Pseudonocardiales bacterium]|jgi:cell division inhibitor SepF|nr:cell division inhibitor SepF [Pseudonocardiales bacterium]
MGAMYKLKAYFGMVPAEELGEYPDELAQDRYPAARRVERGAREYGDDRWDDRFSREESDSYDDEWDRRPARPTGVDRAVPSVSREPSREPSRGGAGFGTPSTRGSLAMDTDAFHPEPALRESARPVIAAAVPEQRERPVGGAAALARITTLHPRSYKEAREIGERYREGVPVIMNLTELDAADAKRLVDFAAGLVFALRGGFDKVTNRVFLLTPADVEVSADDARKLAERGSFRHD